MSKNEYTLRDALIDWATKTGCVFLTDNEEDPDGVIVSDDHQLLIRNEGEGPIVYYKGDDPSLELLKDLLYRAKGTVKLFAEGYSFCLTITD